MFEKCVLLESNPGAIVPKAEAVQLSQSGLFDDLDFNEKMH